MKLITPFGPSSSLIFSNSGVMSNASIIIRKDTPDAGMGVQISCVVTGVGCAPHNHNPTTKAIC